jgi:bifunctional non-homologous end joining protein LigD
MARRDAADVRLLTRSGHDWTGRFALIAQAASALRVTSCLIDGEAVACDDDGLPVFERLRQRRHDRHVVLYAFDLIELNGNDLRRGPLQVRKTTLASVLGQGTMALTGKNRVPERRWHRVLRQVFRENTLRLNRMRKAFG